VFRGLFVALLLVLALTVMTYAPVLAADPVATPAAAASPVLVDPLDPRAGQGASKVGAPFLAVLIVVGIGIAAVAGTFVVVRLTQRA
jgi:hypothetical protein